MTRVETKIKNSMKYSEHHACTQTNQYILKSKPAIRSPFRKQKIKTINLFTNNQEITKIISKKKVHFTHTVDHQDRSTHSKDDVHIQTRKSHSERFLTICREVINAFYDYLDHYLHSPSESRKSTSTLHFSSKGCRLLAILMGKYRWRELKPK